MTHNVLISSAGRRGELVKIFQDCQRLGGFGGKVFAIDLSTLTAAGWLSDGLDLVPAIADDRYVAAVLEVCERRQIRHLVPTIDPELPVYAAAREQFENHGVEVWVSAPEAVAIAQDKRATNRWLRRLGLPAVAQVDLAEALGDPDLVFPLIAKPARGSSSIGLVVARTREDLLALDRTADYVVEELAPGVEYTVDVLIDPVRDEVVLTVPRRRLATRAGEVSKGVTADVPIVREVAKRVVESLKGARGILNVQIFHDEATDAVHVIEINARLGGGFPLAWAAGGQAPLWLMERLAGSRPTATLDWAPGLLMLRYDAATFLPMPGAS